MGRSRTESLVPVYILYTGSHGSEKLLTMAISLYVDILYLLLKEEHSK